MKKFISTIALVGLMLVAFAPVANALSNPFLDLQSDHPNYEAILSLYDWGTISGYPDGTFKPDNEINRAEFLKILVGSDNLQSFLQSNCFTDVSTEWFSPFVCAGKSFGWVDGYPDGSYKPAQTVNKVEAIKMVLNAQGLDELPLQSEITEKPFDDVSLNQWYTPYVVRAKDLGILEEMGANLNPGDNMTRAAICEMMYRSEFAVVPAPGFEKDLASAIVTRVVDGDTIEVDLDGVTEKVRLLGIDTPELSGSECYAQEATDYLESLVLNEEVMLVRDALNDDRDRYDRLLRYVELDGVDINMQMVSGGYALYYDTYDVLRGDEYGIMEVLAEIEGAGLWGECDGAVADPVAPAAPVLGGDVVIFNVFYDGVVPYVESDEYVEVKNEGSAAVNLQGYRISGSKGDEFYTFPSLSLGAGESVKVYTNQGDYSFGNNQAIWNNSGETVYLRDSDGVLVDEWGW